MKDKIIQISGFGVANVQSTQCDYLVAGLTASGKVVITTGDGIWSDISPKASQPAVEADAKSRCVCERYRKESILANFCYKCGRDLRTA